MPPALLLALSALPLTASGTLSPPFTSESTSTGTPGREEPTSISTVGVPISDHRTHTTPDDSGSTTDGGPTTGSEPTTDGGPTTDGEPTIDGGPTTDGNSEPSGSDELHNGTTPQSGTRGEMEFMTVNSFIEG